MLYVTGDTRRAIDINKLSSNYWKEGNTLTKNDTIIIVGDFGLPWFNKNHKLRKEDEYWLDWLNSKSFTVAFIDGNHENFTELLSYPTIDKWNGRVGKMRDSVYYLKRGEVYTIGGKNIFTFGGAESVDKAQRVLGISWWKEELPTYEEYNYGMDNLSKNNNEVDYIITHTCPESFINKLDLAKLNDPVSKYLEHIYSTVSFKKWYFGHFHRDIQLDSDMRCLFKDIIRIED